MLIKFSRLSVLCIIAIALGAVTPHYYWKAVRTKEATPYLNFSSVKKDFLYAITEKEDNDLEYTRGYYDTNGNSYSRKDYSKLTPLTSYSSLQYFGIMPKVIEGIEVNSKMLKFYTENFMIKPTMLIPNFPQMKFTPLFESKPGKRKLDFPKDLFEVTDSMKFYRAANNTFEKEKSELFTNALKEKGFKFPASIIAGNPTTRKPFDEGYLMVDQNNKVFHVKQVKGKPWIHETEIRLDSKIKDLTFWESYLKDVHGTLITEDNQVYFIMWDNYKLVKLPLKDYNPETMRFRYSRNLLYRTFVYNKENEIVALATDLNFNPVKEYRYQLKKTNNGLKKQISEALFPFSVETDSRNDEWQHLDFKLGNKLSLIGIMLSLLLYALFLKQRGFKLKDNLIDFVFIGVTGIYGLVAALIVQPED